MKNFLINLFLPSANNSYRPYLLNNLSLGLIALFVFVSQFGLKTYYQKTQVLGEAVTINEEEIIQLTNQQRLANNLTALNTNEKLSLAAQLKLKDMFEFDYWDHFSPSKRAPWEFIIKSGYSYKLAGENLGRDFYSSQKLVDAWMNSEGHKANLLKPEFRDIGVAIGNGKIDGKDTILIVQFFGEPAPLGAIVIDEQDKNEAFVVAGGIINQERGVDNKLLNIPLTSKTITLFTIFVLITVLTIDAIIMTRIHKVKRISGKYWAHMIFLYSLGVVSYWVGTK